MRIQAPEAPVAAVSEQVHLLHQADMAALTLKRTIIAAATVVPAVLP